MSVFISDLGDEEGKSQFSLLETMLFSLYARCTFGLSCLTAGQAAGLLPGHPELGQTVLLSLPVASAHAAREKGT